MKLTAARKWFKENKMIVKSKKFYAEFVRTDKEKQGQYIFDSNSFLANAHILYLVKPPEHQQLFDIVRGVKNGNIGQKWISIEKATTQSSVLF